MPVRPLRPRQPARVAGAVEVPAARRARRRSGGSKTRRSIAERMSLLKQDAAGRASRRRGPGEKACRPETRARRGCGCERRPAEPGRPRRRGLRISTTAAQGGMSERKRMQERSDAMVRRSSRRSRRRTWPRAAGSLAQDGRLLSIRPRHVMTHGQHVGRHEEVRVPGRAADQGPEARRLRARPRHPTCEDNVKKYRSIEGVREGAGRGFSTGGERHRPPDRVRAALRRAGAYVVASTRHSKHVRGPRGARHAGRADRRRGDLGHGRVLVADPADVPGRAEGTLAPGATGRT